MAIQKLTGTTNLPTPRHWGLHGRPNMGKSTFLAALRGPLLVIDADHRIREIMALCADRGVDLYRISDKEYEHIDPLMIARIIEQERRALSGTIGTVVVDSITAILSPYVTAAMEENRRGVNKNKAAAFAAKANVIRLIQDAVTSLGADTIYIWHTEDNRDQNGQKSTRQTMPETERKRIMRSLNAVMEIGCDSSKTRFARIIWSRSGYGTGTVITDTEGFWHGVPEKLDEALAKPVEHSHPAVSG